jgi:chromosome partitioning protein
MLAVMAVANHKGGTGKSTASMMIAEGAAFFGGLRVLVMDLDPQGGLSRMLMAERDIYEAAQNGRCLLDLMRRFASTGYMTLPPVITQGVSDVRELQNAASGARIDLVASHPASLKDMTDVESKIRSHDPQTRLDLLIAGALTDELRRIEPHYDLVILDCPSGSAALSLAALRSSTIVVAPTVLERNALSALGDFIRIIMDSDLEIYQQLADRAYMLVTMFVRSNSAQQLLLGHVERGQAALNAIPQAISYSTAIQRAASHPGPDAQRLIREKYNSAYNEFECLSQCVRDILLSARRSALANAVAQNMTSITAPARATIS